MMKTTTNIAIFVSGNGTNCENIIRYFSGHESVRVALVLSNRADAFALERARRLKVPSVVVGRDDFRRAEVVMPLMEQYKVGFIVLAGFLLMAPDFLIDAYPRRMLNIHPSLLPKYGGRGMWGHHIHEAVRASGDTVTGITVHYVSNVCDGGEIVFQAETPVGPDDTPDDIAAHIHQLEQQHFPRVIEQVITQL